ncbi:MAG: DUF1700 domain-containing protein [Clostridiales bacterium]|nr:DUF1700 domain-containing protein [Clostridiales bacterium]
MNKKEYISALRAQLRRLPSDDVEDIVKEFENHFDIGISEGKNESDIAAKLGSPEEVAQIYLSDSVPAFDVNGASNVCATQMPIIPVKTGMVIDRGVGPQTAAGFAPVGYAKAPVNAEPSNTAPKSEPADAPNAHTGAKEKEEYTATGPQTGKTYATPNYQQYPSQDPNVSRPIPSEHNVLFAVLFTIFVFVPVWIVALAIILLLIGLTIGLGALSVMLFCWLPSLTVAVGGTVCLALSLAFGAIATAFVTFFAIKGFVVGTIAYIRFIAKGCKAEPKGGNV